ncbi:MAG: hypothetical protein Tsb0020_13420 [Haliangiales bacterium]
MPQRAQSTPTDSATRWPNLSFPLKLLLLFLTFVLIPTITQTILGRQATMELFHQNTHQSLRAAAQQTALRLDGFLSSRLGGVARQAELPVIVEFLRGDAAQNQQLRPVIRQILQSLLTQDRVFARSATILNVDGVTAAIVDDDHTTSHPGADEFFEQVMSTGAPLLSDVLFAPNGEAYFYFGAPILRGGAPIGVLRVGYQAKALQNQLVVDSGRLGPASFPVLFDENLLCLAHAGASPGTDSPLLYQFVSAPSASERARLLRMGRTPVSHGQPDLRRQLPAMPQLYDALTRVSEQRLGFHTPAPGRADYMMTASVASMETKPWQMVFFQPLDALLVPTSKIERDLFYESVVLIVVLLAIAMFLIRRLTRPIVELTQVTKSFGTGALQVRANIQQNDEIGSLARAFNSMAATLQARIESQSFIALTSRRIINTNIEALDDTLRAMPNTLADFFGADRATIIRFCDRREPAPAPQAARTVYTSDPAPSAAPVSDDELPEVVALDWLIGHFDHSDIVHRAAIRHRTFAGAGIGSLLVAPLTPSSEMSGMICLLSTDSESPWRQSEEQLLSLVAEIISRALHRQDSNARIRALNEGLEQRVAARTAELQQTNQKLEQEIEERIRLQAERDEMNDKLYDVARQAGMAEVATTVLHNVGNALNSVGVTAFLFDETLRESPHGRVGQVAELLREHQDDLASYFTTGKGAMLPSYLDSLAEKLNHQHDRMSKELRDLRSSLEHANEIVRAQQSIALHIDAAELRAPAMLMDEAVRICSESLNRYHIHVERDYRDSPAVSVMRHKVLQILVNLLNNAKDALLDESVSERRLTLRIDHCRFDELDPDELPIGGLDASGEVQHEGDQLIVGLHVIDTGVGIRPEDRKQLFRYGFTTKPDGHGFGLHGSALAARELGGWMAVASDGVGRGARFSLYVWCPRDDEA